MVTASTGVQTDLSQVVHSSCRSFCHSPEAQSSTIHVFSPRPKCLGHRCSEHKLLPSHCLCLPSHGSPSQGDPNSQAIQLPGHCNSPRLARDNLVLGAKAALNRDPTSTSIIPLHNFRYGRPLLTLWAQRGSISLKVQTLTRYSPVFTGIIPKVPGIFLSGTFLLFSMSSQKHLLSL